MASLLITRDGVDTTTGYPRHVCFGDGLEKAREFPRSAGKLPWGVTPEEYWALQYWPIPEAAIADGDTQQEGLALLRAAFGSSRSEYEREWVPTSARAGRKRAWIFRRRSQEGGGDNWFGDPIYHDDAEAAAWLDIDVVAPWAQGLFASSFGHALKAAGFEQYATLPVPENVDLLTWAGDLNLRGGKTGTPQIDETGVYVDYRVSWGGSVPEGKTLPNGGWTGTLRQRHPGAWVVTTDHRRVKEWLHLPATIYANGTEEHVYLGGEDNTEPRVETSLPATPEPTDATGDYAAFFPTEEALKEFCLRHNIVADVVWLGLHAPWDNEPGAHLLALTHDWAIRAWREGAAMTPPVTGTVPPVNEWTKREESGFVRYYFQVGGNDAQAYPNKDDGYSVHIQNGDGNCTLYPRGWVRIPANVPAKVSHGLTVREPGDDRRDSEEVVVFTDGHLSRTPRKWK